VGFGGRLGLKIQLAAGATLRLWGQWTRSRRGSQRVRPSSSSRLETQWCR
jgi:hypothetical protein